MGGNKRERRRGETKMGRENETNEKKTGKEGRSEGRKQSTRKSGKHLWGHQPREPQIEGKTEKYRRK